MPVNKTEWRERSARLIDDLERWKHAFEGRNELRVGNATAAHAIQQAIEALLDARELVK